MIWFAALVLQVLTGRAWLVVTVTGSRAIRPITEHARQLFANGCFR